MQLSIGTVTQVYAAGTCVRYKRHARTALRDRRASTPTSARTRRRPPESRRWQATRPVEAAGSSNVSGANEFWEPSGEPTWSDARPHTARKPQVNSTQGHAQPHGATGGVCMACKRSGVRIPIAPRFRSSEAIFADHDHLLFVQEVTLYGELT
jgi:hypothetical protein